MELTALQEEFLGVLLECKVSSLGMLAVMSVIDTPLAVLEMVRRIEEEYNKGTELNEQVVLRIMVDMCKEASEEADRLGIKLWEDQEE